MSGYDVVPLIALILVVFGVVGVVYCAVLDCRRRPSGERDDELHRVRKVAGR
jgi:hypothetical protein